MVGSWVEISDGCPLRFEVAGSGLVYVLCGSDPIDCFQFTLDFGALRDFLRKGAEVLCEMDAIAAHEEDQAALLT